MHVNEHDHPRLFRTSHMLSTSFEYVAKYTKVRARACGGVRVSGVRMVRDAALPMAAPAPNSSAVRTLARPLLCAGCAR